MLFLRVSYYDCTEVPRKLTLITKAILCDYNAYRKHSSIYKLPILGVARTSSTPRYGPLYPTAEFPNSFVMESNWFGWLNLFTCSGFQILRGIIANIAPQGSVL